MPRYGPRKNFRGYIGTCIDVTDLMQKEEKLKEVEERVTLAAEAAHLGVWELDPETNEVWASDKARELFELAPEARITYTDLRARVHPEDRVQLDAATQKAIKNKNGYETEYRVVRSDGSLRWTAGRGHCVVSEQDKCRLLGVSMDITMRKQAEEQARRSRQQVDLLSRASLLGEMTASLAHELNQPLSAIVTNATAAIEYIDKGRLDAEQLREIFTDVAADGQRAHYIIDNVRSAIKKGSAIRSRINLNDVVKSVTHMVYPEAAAHFCALEVSLAENLPTMDGDPTQMQQVLINLIRNAFDAMHDTPPARRVVQITTSYNGANETCVAVRDYGTGIPATTRERLFEQFFTTKEEGLGMGLSIVRSIVESHGGRVMAENAAGGGARFYFHVPIQNEVLT
jgi:PAS domain S-box-containing protein